LVVGTEEPSFDGSDTDDGVGSPQPIDATVLADLAHRCVGLTLLRVRAVPAALRDGVGLSALCSSGAPLTTLDLANCGVSSLIGEQLAALGVTLRDISLAGAWCI
jgi:hypothetical protein